MKKSILVLFPIIFLSQALWAIDYAQFASEDQTCNLEIGRHDDGKIAELKISGQGELYREEPNDIYSTDVRLGIRDSYENWKETKISSKHLRFTQSSKYYTEDGRSPYFGKTTFDIFFGYGGKIERVMAVHFKKRSGRFVEDSMIECEELNP